MHDGVGDVAFARQRRVVVARQVQRRAKRHRHPAGPRHLPLGVQHLVHALETHRDDGQVQPRADHAADRAGGGGELGDEPRFAIGSEIQLAQHLECVREQRIAGQGEREPPRDGQVVGAAGGPELLPGPLRPKGVIQVPNNRAEVGRQRLRPVELQPPRAAGQGEQARPQREQGAAHALFQLAQCDGDGGLRQMYPLAGLCQAA